MTLQARLTLWSIIFMALLVGFVSAVDLTDEIDRQFKATLEHSELIRKAAATVVIHSLDRGASDPRKTILSDTRLQGELLNLMINSHALMELAVCDTNNTIIADSDPSRVHNQFAGLEDFGSLVRGTKWWNKLDVLLRGETSYQISEDVAEAGQTKPIVSVRAIIFPGLIRDDIMPALKAHMIIASASIVGAMLAALLFSTVAFRPLGKLGQMLDLLAKGQFEMTPVPPGAGAAEDEFGVVASKVSMLGERLRGAQSEFSDLKGNFERLLDELEDAVLIFGRDHRLIAAAGAVERFLERPRAQFLGQTLTEIFPPATSLGLLLAQATQTGRPIRNRRVPITRSNNGASSLFIALLSVEILDANTGPGPRAGMLIRLRDPEATRQIGRQLQTADRLSAISRLTGGVAHEVKNPLNAILMHVELARMKLAHGDYELEPQMDVISNEILRLDRVVKTFLDFTRPVKLNLTEVPLESFVNDVADLARPQAAAAGIQLRVEQHTEGVSLTVDVDLIKQAVLNIVVNAIEAMPQGGELRFESVVKGDDAEIRISDTGPGISTEEREKIFNLYFTTKKTGSGIGLAMTYRILQLHDGTIDVASEPGKGATFALRLPVAVLTT